MGNVSVAMSRLRNAGAIKSNRAQTSAGMAMDGGHWATLGLGLLLQDTQDKQLAEVSKDCAHIATCGWVGAGGIRHLVTRLVCQAWTCSMARSKLHLLAARPRSDKQNVEPWRLGFFPSTDSTCRHAGTFGNLLRTLLARVTYTAATHTRQSGRPWSPSSWPTLIATASHMR